MAYTANNPAAVSVIIDVLAGLGLVVGDAQDIRDDRQLDAMVAVRRNGAVNVVGLADKADDVFNTHGDFIAHKSRWLAPPSVSPPSTASPCWCAADTRKQGTGRSRGRSLLRVR